MNRPNPYSPPTANLEPTVSSETSIRDGNWFAQRPIPVYIIAVFCTLQFIGVSLAVVDARSQLLELVNTGAMSVATFVGKLLYPTLLFLGGAALLFLKRASIVFFACYFAWGVAKIVAAPTEFYSYLSLSIVFGVAVYCIRLAKNGVLR